MAFVKIRGQQIQSGTLSDAHLAANAAIAESKLNINWSARAQDVLSSKKIVDFVQVNGTAVGGLQKYDLSANAIIANTQAKTDSDPLSVEGVIVSGTKNVAPVRDASTGEPIVANAAGDEVYGRVVFIADDPNTLANEARFELQFFYFDSALAVETAYTMGTGVSIDWQYAQRFNLQSVNEMFAANEKFVNGAADVTAHLNAEQLAKDLYGATWSLDRDGAANLSRSVVDEIAVQTKGVTNTAVRANTIIDEVVSGRGTFTSIGGRIADGENRISTAETNITNIQNEITTARGTDTSLDARLDGIDTSLAQEKQDREYFDVTIQKETGSYGVASGGAVTQTTTASMTLNVASGAFYQPNGRRNTESAGTVSITAADATNPRIDVVYFDTVNDVYAVVKGTAGVSPAIPAVPADGIKLAEVYVAAGATAISTSNITDKRDYIATDAEVKTARASFATLNDRLFDIETKATGSNDEVIDARTSTALTGTAVTHTSLDIRIEEGEKVIKANKDEISLARGSHIDLNGRISSIQNEVEAGRKSTALTGTEVIHTSLDVRIEEGEKVIKANKDEIFLARGSHIDLNGRISAIQTEVENARSSMVKSTDGTNPKVFASVDARLEDIETLHKNVSDEVFLARGSHLDLNGRITAIQDEVTNARSSMVKSTDGVNPKVFTSVDERLEDIETLHKNVSDEIFLARGSYLNLDGRLDAIEADASAANTEVSATHSREINTMNGVFNAQTFTTLEARLEDIENGADRVQGDIFQQNIMIESAGVKNNTGQVLANSPAAMNVIIDNAEGLDPDGKRFFASGTYTIAAADATNPRIDIVVVDKTNGARVIQGTPAISPVAPATPAGSVLLAEVRVPAGDTAIEQTQITDKRKFLGTGKEVQDARVRTSTSMGGLYTAETFYTLYDRINSAEDGADRIFGEVKTARGTYTNLDARLDAIDSTNSTQDTAINNVKTEVEAARSTTALTGTAVNYLSLDERLEASDTQVKTNKDNITTLQNDAIKIHKYTYQATGGESTVNLPTGRYFVAGDDSLDIYLNGALQSVGLHYSEVKDAIDTTKGLGVDFAPETLVAGDIVTFKYSKKNSLGN